MLTHGEIYGDGTCITVKIAVTGIKRGDLVHYVSPLLISNIGRLCPAFGVVDEVDTNLCKVCISGVRKIEIPDNVSLLVGTYLAVDRGNPVTSVFPSNVVYLGEGLVLIGGGKCR
jgi:hypothetical protein